MGILTPSCVCVCVWRCKFSSCVPKHWYLWWNLTCHSQRLLLWHQNHWFDIYLVTMAHKRGSGEGGAGMENWQHLQDVLREAPLKSEDVWRNMAPERKPSSVTQQVSSSPLYFALYVILVLLGNVGNTTVIAVVGDSLLRETGVVRSSDVILVNMAFSNLMVSLVRNTVVMVSDLGAEVGWRDHMDGRLVGLIIISECGVAIRGLISIANPLKWVWTQPGVIFGPVLTNLSSWGPPPKIWWVYWLDYLGYSWEFDSLLELLIVQSIRNQLKTSLTLNQESFIE